MPYYEKQPLRTSMCVDELPPSNLRWTEDDQEARLAQHGIGRPLRPGAPPQRATFLSMYGLRNHPDITEDDLNTKGASVR